MSNGGFIAVWINKATNQMSWRIFNTDSFTPASDEKEIIGQVVDATGDTDVCQLADGSFLITWAEAGVDASGLAVMA